MLSGCDYLPPPWSFNWPATAAWVAALLAVENGEADVSVVAKLDRLSRSLLDFATSWNAAVESAGRSWPSTLGSTPRPVGEIVVSLLATSARHERRDHRRADEGSVYREEGRGCRPGPTSRALA